MDAKHRNRDLIVSRSTWRKVNAVTPVFKVADTCMRSCGTTYRNLEGITTFCQSVALHVSSLNRET